MKEAYYAVRKGNNIGIYNTWEECKKAVQGYSNAEYKKFSTQKEAEAFINEENVYEDTLDDDIKNGYVVAYTDGSYDPKLKRYSYGVVCFDKDKNETDLYNYSSNEKYIEFNNIIGEMLGVFNALDWAIEKGYSKIKIYYDYEGIGKWAKQEWKANSEVAKMYLTKMKIYMTIIEIEFIKVKGHSNNKYNERADRLAKDALKNGTKKISKGSSWITITFFEKENLNKIMNKMKKELEGIKVECKIQNEQKIIYKLKLEKNEITVTLFDNQNKLLLIQGSMNIVFQAFLTYINEILGLKKVKYAIGEAYKKKINTSEVEKKFEEKCPKLPEDYPESYKDLIRQAIINLSYSANDCIDYSQFAFPALRALEGHLKYVCEKAGIHITKKFSIFNKQENRYYLNKPIQNQAIKLYIEELYNYFEENRHTLFHVGEIIGTTSNTRTIETKDEANEIIEEIINKINKINKISF